MKKAYKSPSICVENVKLSPFCESGCQMTEEQWKDIVEKWEGVPGITVMFGEYCYCYNGSTFPDTFVSPAVNS